MKLMRAKLLSGTPAQAVLMLQLNIENLLQEAGKPQLGLALIDSNGVFKRMHTLKQEIARAALHMSNGNQIRAADLLGISRNTLRTMIPDEELPRRARSNNKQRQPP